MAGMKVSMNTDLFPDASAALDRLCQAFAAVPDSCQAGKILHRLDEILVGSLCSMLCDFCQFTSFAEFFRLQIGWLRGFLALEKDRRGGGLLRPGP
jgi:hypothetical protein